MKNKKLIIAIEVIVVIIILILISIILIKKDNENKIDNNKQNNISSRGKETTSSTKKQEVSYKETNKLRDFLDDLYKNKNYNEIKKLEKNATKEQLEIITNYKAADKERKNKKLDYQTGKILAMVDNDKNFDKIAETYRGTVLNKIKMDNNKTMLVIKTSLEYTVDKAISKYETMDGVIITQPNYIYKTFEQEKYTVKETANNILSINTNDTNKNSLWHLNTNTGINIQPAWDLLDKIPNKTKIKVAVIDTGINRTHEDLQSTLATANATVGKSNSQLVTIDNGNGNVISKTIGDSVGHGTHVSGIIAATSNNNLGVAGVGSGNKNDMINLVGVDAFCDDCYNGYDYGGFTDEDLIAAIRYVRTLGVKAINLSLGAQRVPDSDQLLHNAITEAYNDGISCIAAAGNSDDGVNYFAPSDYDECISVIALDSNNNRAGYSNYGNDKDISAPGGSGINYTSDVGVFSTYQSSYAYMPGTSMAAPVVSGVVGMMYSAKPTLTPAEVQTIIQNKADDLGTPGFDVQTGYGKINPLKSVWNSEEKINVNITTDNLMDGRKGFYYSQTLIATGYPSDFTWSKESGTLPVGLTLSNAGVISGTPTETGTKTFTIKLNNGDTTQNKEYSITINENVNITTNTLESGYKGVSYSQSLQAIGYPENITWTKTGGDLPTGLTLSNAGVISGTPTEEGTYSFVVEASNGVTTTASKTFTIVIYDNIKITTSSLNNGTREIYYNMDLVASETSSNLNWSIIEGNLPTGLTLNNGKISGTPTEIGTFNFKVKITKGTLESTKSFTLIINERNLTPLNFRVYLNTYNSVTVTYNSVPNISYYKIYYRRSGTSTWYSYTTTSTFSRKYYLPTNATYYFKVEAQGYYTKAVTGELRVITLKKPTIKLYKRGSRTIKVKWSNIAGESGYEIYRKTPGKKWKKVKTRSYKYSSWKNTKRVRGKKYYYKVRAYTWVNGKKVYSQFSKKKYKRR